MSAKPPCELCGKESDMDFNSVIPVSDEEAALVKSDICFNCFGKYADDFELSIAILEKRVTENLGENWRLEE